MPVKKQQVTMEQDDIAAKGMDYYLHKQEIKKHETEIKRLRTSLEEYLKNNNQVLPSGTQVAQLPFADKNVILKNTYRLGASLVAEAIDIAKTIAGLEDCVETVEILREDILESKVIDGTIDEEVLKRFYETKESYAFSVDVKKKTDEKLLDI